MWSKKRDPKIPSYQQKLHCTLKEHKNIDELNLKYILLFVANKNFI
jgi:hypothetical protein